MRRGASFPSSACHATARWRSGSQCQPVNSRRNPLISHGRKPRRCRWGGLTAWRAVVTRAAVLPGERVLVTGIGGGVALLALQFAAQHGAEVWVTSSDDGKIARAVSLGANAGANYTQPGWAADLLKRSGGFDVIVDSAGGDGFSDLIDLAKPGGRIVSFGATRGNPSSLTLRKIFWRQLSLLGTTMGMPVEFAAMAQYVTMHRLKPVISEVIPFERAGEAFDLMERGGQFGKIVVRMS